MDALCRCSDACVAFYDPFCFDVVCTLIMLRGVVFILVVSVYMQVFISIELLAILMAGIKYLHRNLKKAQSLLARFLARYRGSLLHVSFLYT